MHEKVNRWAIIAIIAASALGLATFSVLQSEQRKEKQQAAFDLAAKNEAETEAVMKKIGQEALSEEQQRNNAAQAEYLASPQYAELKRLEEEDRDALAR